MSTLVRILNGTNSSRDAGIQSAPSLLLDAGVRKNFTNELEVTAGQVNTGMAFVEVTRTTVTPNETFIIPVLVTSAVTGLDTTTVGNYIIISLDQDKINDGSLNESDGSEIATVESVAVLPSSNFIELAEIEAGPVITDQRVWAQVSEDAVRDVLHYDEDVEAIDAYEITVNGVKELNDGAEFSFKANTVNTGAATLNINSLGAKDIRKLYNVALATNDVPAGAIIVVKYDLANDWFQLVSTPATIASIVKASDAAAAAGVDDSDYMTVDKVVHLLGNLVNTVLTYFVSTRAAKTTPISADAVMVMDSEDSNKDKKMTVANLAKSFVVAVKSGSTETFFSDATEYDTTSTSYVQLIADKIFNSNGSVLVSAELKNTTDGQNMSVQVSYTDKTGAAATLVLTSDSTGVDYSTKTGTIYPLAGSTLELDFKMNSSGHAYAQNFAIKGVEITAADDPIS